jgi:hypothetical protein
VSSSFIPAPPPPAADQHRIVRTRQFRVDRARILTVLESIITLVRAERTTGAIWIDLSSGTPVAVRLEESQRIGPIKLGEDLPL